MCGPNWYAIRVQARCSLRAHQRGFYIMLERAQERQSSDSQQNKEKPGTTQISRRSTPFAGEGASTLQHALFIGSRLTALHIVSTCLLKVPRMCSLQSAEAETCRCRCVGRACAKLPQQDRQELKKKDIRRTDVQSSYRVPETRDTERVYRVPTIYFVAVVLLLYTSKNLVIVYSHVNLSSTYHTAYISAIDIK